MTKRIGLKTMNQGAALATDTLALPALVIEGLEEFKGSFDRLCLQADCGHRSDAGVKVCPTEALPRRGNRGL